MSYKSKCEKCHWSSGAYGYEGDCHYHFLGGKGRCRFVDKMVMIDILDLYNSRMIDAENEKNEMIKRFEEECFYDED